MRKTNNRQQELTPEQTTRIDRLLAAQKKYLDRADDTAEASNELKKRIREAVDAGVTRHRVAQELSDNAGVVVYQTVISRLEAA